MEHSRIVTMRGFTFLSGNKLDSYDLERKTFKE